MKTEKLTIIPVQTKKELKQFILLPWKIYKGDKNWVPPLISERKDFLNPQKNPFFKHAEVKFFLAKKGNEVVGRIAGIVNHLHIQTHNEKCGFFGLFECIEDYEVAKALLDTAKTWLKSKGMERMRGPADFSSNDQWGFLLEGFDSPPVFMMPYNPKYYLEFMERYGLKKSKDLYAYYLNRDKKPPERIYKVAEKIKQKENLVVRKINMDDFESEVKKIKEIYNLAWSRNWGAIPMTDEEFSHMAKEMKQIMDKDLIFIAEVDGNPAGFSLAIPNVNEALIKLNGRLFPFGIFKLLYYAKKIKSSRIITMGVIHKYQKRGIDNIFYTQTFDEGVKKGYIWGELSWILEDNVLMNRAAELMNARLYKKYRIYEGEV
ncbi:MAG: N-acetyltransferase [candidate division Zixibacteria bacterium]|nr:N-acetyltransferase [candidate division Zixibacteria bacterium]